MEPARVSERRTPDVEHDSKHTGRDSRRPAFFSIWLSWKELKGRKFIFLINVTIIALLLALPVSLDLMGNARKSAVRSRVDYIGPSLIIVPKGIRSSDLVTAQLEGKSFSLAMTDEISMSYSSYLRAAEPRLTVRLSAEGRSIPVSGIDFNNVYSYPFPEYSLNSGQALLGAVAAEKLQKDRGDVLQIRSQAFSIAGIIPTTGGIEDASAFIPLPVLQEMVNMEGRINEIRIFPSSESSYQVLKDRLEEVTGNLNIIDAYRGDRAEKDIDSALLTYQKALYAVAYILIAICIMISTYINLDSRKPEVSTVYTLGAAQGIIFQVLTLRTIWIALAGACAGYLLSLVITVLQVHDVPLRLIWSPRSLTEAVLGTVALGVVVTIPFAWWTVFRKNHLSDL